MSNLEELTPHECLIAISEAGRIGAEMSGQERPLSKTLFHEASHSCIQQLLGLDSAIRIDASGGVASHAEDGVFAADSVSDLPTDAEYTARVVEKSPDPIDLEELRGKVHKVLRAHWSFIAAVAASLEARLIGRSEDFRVVMNRGELRRLWEFHLEAIGKCAD